MDLMRLSKQIAKMNRQRDAIDRRLKVLLQAEERIRGMLKEALETSGQELVERQAAAEAPAMAGTEPSVEVSGDIPAQSGEPPA